MAKPTKRSHKNTPRLTAPERAILAIREYAGLTEGTSDRTIRAYYIGHVRAIVRQLKAHAKEAMARDGRRGAKKGR